MAESEPRYYIYDYDTNTSHIVTDHTTVPKIGPEASESGYEVNPGTSPIREFGTGAHRNGSEGKGRYDLIPRKAKREVAIVLEAGGKRHGDYNWHKGIPYSSLIDSAQRHIDQWAEGMTDEKHLAHAICNLLFLLEFEEEGRAAELDDVRDYQSDEYGEGEEFWPSIWAAPTAEQVIRWRDEPNVLSKLVIRDYEKDLSGLGDTVRITPVGETRQRSIDELVEDACKTAEGPITYQDMLDAKKLIEEMDEEWERTKSQMQHEEYQRNYPNEYPSNTHSDSQDQTEPSADIHQPGSKTSGQLNEQRDSAIDSRPSPPWIRVEPDDIHQSPRNYLGFREEVTE